MFLPPKKMLALSGLAGFIFLGMTAAKLPGEDESEYKNLRVLSKKITEKDMDYVMETFSANLGVNCLFCHISIKKGYDFSIDYASDSLLNKRVSRDMLRMTLLLNRKYFNIKMPATMKERGRVWCRTCHQGKPVPIFTH
jgi:Photosynthetic reaction centre cytochrome C subunit